MREPLIRRGADADLAALVALEEQVFSSDRLSRRQWQRHLRSPRADLLVAAQGDRLLGAALVFHRAGSLVARLYSLAVAPAARGHGLGERLLLAAEEAARARGSALMRLEVRPDNPAAQRLYERAGYRFAGTIPDFYEDGAAALHYRKFLRR